MDRHPITSRHVAAGALVMLLAACSGPGIDDAPGQVRLPDGTSYEIPVLEFSRPVLRDAAGLDKTWQEAGAAYRTGDYGRSERLFGEIESAERRDPQRHDAALYRGIAQLKSGRPQDARQTLRRSRRLASDTGLPSGADSFYLGVADLAGNDLQGANRALREAAGGPFDSEARALLARLTSK